MLKRVVFISSFMRSGSTLLGALLGAGIADAVFLGEVRNLYDAYSKGHSCSCGTPVPQCACWAGVVGALDAAGGLGRTKTASDGGRRLVKYASLLGIDLLRWFGNVPGTFRRQRQALDSILGVYEAAANVQGRSLVIDSSHRMAQARQICFRMPGRVSVLQLFRDGRGVTHSLMKRFSMPMAEAAALWRRNAVYSLWSARTLPGGVFRVHYEDICRDPEQELRRVAGLLGTGVRELAFDRGSMHFIGGSPSFLDSLAAGDIRLDERWRQEMAPGDAQTFERIAGAVNRRLGYV